MNATHSHGSNKTARLREAVAGDVLMREEAARLKQERSLSDSVMDAYEMTDRDERISEVSALTRQTKPPEKLGDQVVFGMVGLLFVWIFLDSMIGVLK